ASRAPRTRSKTLAALRRFGQWAVDEGYLRRNPARAIPRPTVVALAPKELSAQQRYVLGTMVERYGIPRFDAIFAVGYWEGLRISEIAALRLDQCHLDQRAGSITLVDAKGGKTRTLDLHTRARRALLDYLAPADPRDASCNPESAYVFTSQRAAWLRHKRRPDHLSERGIEHLWTRFKRHGTYDEWQLVEEVAFHDLRHDFAHRARASGWSLEEIAVYLGPAPDIGCAARPRRCACGAAPDRSGTQSGPARRHR